MSPNPHGTCHRKMSLTPLAIPLVLSLSLSVLACSEPEIGASTLAAHGSNALSENRLSYNRLSYNRLSYNRLSYNRLSYNRLSYNSLDNDMHKTDEGLELLRYIVRCALVEGDSLVVELDNDEVIELPGSLGLAEDWIEEPLDEDGQLRISGCLIAHVNAFGVSVPLSLRFQPDVKRTEEERETFNRYEGVFFGNLFSKKVNQLYACYADEPPQGLDTRHGDRLLRLCTSEDCGPIKSLGACSSICQGSSNGNFKDCMVPDGAKHDYKRPIHVWLLDWDDERSVWPQHVDLLKEHYSKEKTEAQDEDHAEDEDQDEDQDQDQDGPPTELKAPSTGTIGTAR